MKKGFTFWQSKKANQELKSNNTGFTLVELLVVISIISILSTIGVISYQNFLKNGRDIKRQSDLRTVQSALEQFRADQGYYPEYSAGSCASLPVNKLQFGCPLKGDFGGSVKTYYNQLPQEQLTAPQPSYSYVPKPDSCSNAVVTSRCTFYCLYAKLEQTPPSLPDVPASCSLGSYNFLVYPP